MCATFLRSVRYLSLRSIAHTERSVKLTEPRWRFMDIANKIEALLDDEGIGSEAEVEVDFYNNTIEVYYESTEQWREDIQEWDSWDEDEKRWLNHE
jgi:hypothetical protein